MQIYQILSTIKIIIGISTIVLTRFRISPIVDTNTGIILILIGLFLSLRGVGFWLSYFAYLILSHKKLSIIASQSYKISFLFGIYGLINFIMIAYEIRNPIIGITITGFFLGITTLMFRSINYKFDNISSASTIPPQDI